MSTGTCCSTRDELPGVSDVRNAFQLHAVPNLRANSGTRRKREFTPDEQKDTNYWLKRNRNNEAAKRSRQRKRMEEHLLETRAVELQRENDELKAALSAVHHHSSGQEHAVDAALGFPIGLPNDGYPRSLPVPTAVLPLRSLTLPQCQFSACCGSMCPQTNHFSSPFDLNAACNTTKSPRCSLLDGCYPMGRYGNGTNAYSYAACMRSRSFANGSDSSQTIGLPDYISALVNLSRMPRCCNPKTSPSEMAQNCARQPGPIRATYEDATQTRAVERTSQKRATERSVSLPHKLRYKVSNAEFASTYFSP